MVAIKISRGSGQLLIPPKYCVWCTVCVCVCVRVCVSVCVCVCVSHLCSLKTELSRTIFSSSSMSSLGRSAVMKAFTDTDTSSGSCVSGRAVCTTCVGVCVCVCVCVCVYVCTALQGFFTVHLYSHTNVCVWGVFMCMCVCVSEK